MIVQTPQCFSVLAIKKAYEQFKNAAFTDDATLFEAAGGTIKTIPGEPTNIKITWQEDLIFAEAILQSGAKK
jgi:2-C-methyl-D-erythritol 4-phosphate cytidylyltransferase